MCLLYFHPVELLHGQIKAEQKSIRCPVGARIVADEFVGLFELFGQVALVTGQGDAAVQMELGVRLQQAQADFVDSAAGPAVVVGR